MWNIITLDGYFEGEKNWELPFHEKVWGPETEALCMDQLSTTSYLVFGRVTYEGMAAYWQSEEVKNSDGKIANFMNNLPKIVCSRSLKSADWNNSTILRENIAAEISRLKAVSEKDLYVFGSANLSETLIREDLYDEYRIAIAPVIAGRGRPLFSQHLSERNLSLIASQRLENGGVILFYKPLTIR